MLCCRQSGSRAARRRGVVAIKDGLRVSNTASFEADVAAAPDAFLCRLAPAANKDVVQLGIGRVASLGAMPSSALRATRRFAWKGHASSLSGKGAIIASRPGDRWK